MIVICFIVFVLQKHKSDKERYAEMILKSKYHKVGILISICHWIVVFLVATLISWFLALIINPFLHDSSHIFPGRKVKGEGWKQRFDGRIGQKIHICNCLESSYKQEHFNRIYEEAWGFCNSDLWKFWAGMIFSKEVFFFP